MHHYAVVLGGDAEEKQLDQREVDYKAVHADLDVVEEEVEDRAFKVPEKDTTGYELDLEVLEWHVAVMHQDHKKGNYHDKYILQRAKSPTGIEKDRDNTNENPSKDPEVLEARIRLCKRVQ